VLIVLIALVATRFTKHGDQEEIRRAAEEDYRGAAGEMESPSR
jgi:hypothetical protein